MISASTMSSEARTLRPRGGCGRGLRRFTEKLPPAHAEVVGQLLDLVHAGHLGTAAVGGDGGFADPQEMGDIDLLFVVVMNQAHEIVGEQSAVVSDGAGHKKHLFP